MAEMRMTGEAKVQRKHSELRFCHPRGVPTRGVIANALVADADSSRSRGENPSEMKRRAEDRPHEFSGTQFVMKSAGEHEACSIDQITMRLPSDRAHRLANDSSPLMGAVDARRRA